MSVALGEFPSPLSPAGATPSIIFSPRILISQRPRTSGLWKRQRDIVSCLLNAIYRADGYAMLTISLILALIACISIDHVDVSFGNGIGRTFR